MLKQTQNYLGNPSAHLWTAVLSPFELFILAVPNLAYGNWISAANLTRLANEPVQTSILHLAVPQSNYRNALRRFGQGSSLARAPVVASSPAINQTQTAIEKSKALRLGVCHRP